MCWIAPTKRQRLAEWIQKQDPYICCLQETHLKTGDTYRLNEWKYQITNQELSLLNSRISKVLELDPHTPEKPSCPSPWSRCRSGGSFPLPFTLLFWVQVYIPFLCFLSREYPLVFVGELVWWCRILSVFVCLKSFWFLLHTWMRSLLGTIIWAVVYFLSSF